MVQHSASSTGTSIHSKLDEFFSSPSSMNLGHLFAIPTTEEIRGCWELCRLHANTGFWVVWNPTAWSIVMAYHANPEMSMVAALTRALLYVPLCFGIKSLIMAIDDILDHDVDGLVERTKNRAIPRGAISVDRAWVFFMLQILIGVQAAFYFLSPIALRVSMLVWPLYVMYPTCKRWMYYAPIPLGFMFNVGVFMGWADLVGSDGLVPWLMLIPLYLGACLWTLTYETVYQHQDKLDDVKIGLKSLALKVGDNTITFCTATACGFIALLSYAGYMNGHSYPFYASVAIAAWMLLSRLASTDIDIPSDCKTLFLDTPAIGRVILAGLVVDTVGQRLSAQIPIF